MIGIGHLVLRQGGSHGRTIRSEERFQAMLARAEVSPEAMRGLVDRLETFVTDEGIAHPVGQGHLPMRRMIGQPDWDHRPSLATVASEVGRPIDNIEN